MGKNKGIFKKIVAGVMTFTMCLGMVTPAFAKEDSKKNKAFIQCGYGYRYGCIRLYEWK